jgi:phage head maturation protease
MAVEIVGEPSAVKKYREMLHERGVMTKRFMDAVARSGQQLAPKPDGFRLMNGAIKSVHGERKEMSSYDPESKLYIAGVANANAVDRMDERLDPVGIDIKNFMVNRVLLVDHMYATSCVVGDVVDIRSEHDGVHFEAFIGDPKLAPLTQTQINTRSLVAQKLLRTVSVGFIPHKVKAPEFDGEGKLTAPAVILAWELLELSIVAVPANPGAVFDLKSYEPESRKKVFAVAKDLTNNADAAKIEIEQSKEQATTTVQSLIFDKSKFDRKQAEDWAKAHDFRSDKVDETEDSWRLRQREPGDFVEGSFRTIDITDGIKSVIGQLKKDVTQGAAMEQQMVEMLDEMKRMASMISSMNEGVAKILAKMELDATEEPKPEEPKPEAPKPDAPKPEAPKSDESKKLKATVDALSDKLEKLSSIMLSVLEGKTKG